MDRKALIDKLTAQLKQWDAEIEKFEAKAQQANAETRAWYNEQIQYLHGKKQAARDKLNELEQAAEEAWKELKSGTEKAFDELKNAFQNALSKFE
jgi:dsDNA-specific endonuclease/ATPase MutS2